MNLVFLKNYYYLKNNVKPILSSVSLAVNISVMATKTNAE